MKTNNFVSSYCGKLESDCIYETTSLFMHKKFAKEGHVRISQKISGMVIIQVPENLMITAKCMMHEIEEKVPELRFRINHKLKYNKGFKQHILKKLYQFKRNFPVFKFGGEIDGKEIEWKKFKK